ncbi:hypothetical protein OIU84_026852 [Salix udensis]|uniref:Bifunctional inhibitor/plant lipid transfer protein/seed storage helical domain-containing protein n=1 Tax=Salix udensis TaxID=889485 RepID=A0AAD6NMW4_9ROSI|nr:hypothetical protein OIU84_026852 [Salix udensis]
MVPHSFSQPEIPGAHLSLQISMHASLLRTLQQSQSPPPQYPPQCCQGLQNIVAGNATVSLSQAAICRCFTDFVAARIPTVQASLRVSVLASLQTRCNVNIGVNATTCAA